MHGRTRAEKSPEVLLLTLISILILLAIQACSGLGLQNPVQDPRTLAPLVSDGEWLTLPQYGSAWRPLVNHQWRPFYYGKWAWSNYGWTWISYEPFGWIVYHHGYWKHDVNYGWCWIPGYKWCSANVLWISLSSYVGWAPLPPPGMKVGDPWSPRYAMLWNFVRVKDFRNERIQDFVLEYMPIREKIILREPPDVITIQKITGRRNKKIVIHPGSEEGRFQFIDFPPQEKEAIERNQQEMEKTILNPKIKPNRKSSLPGFHSSRLLPKSYFPEAHVPDPFFREFPSQ